MKTTAEIYAMIDACDNSNLHGMSYEDGVRAALEWVIEQTEETPVEIYYEQ